MRRHCCASPRSSPLFVSSIRLLSASPLTPNRPRLAQVRLRPEHAAQFSSWEWRDEVLMQRELLRAIEADASKRKGKGCVVSLFDACGGACWASRGSHEEAVALVRETPLAS